MHSGFGTWDIYTDVSQHWQIGTQSARHTIMMSLIIPIFFQCLVTQLHSLPLIMEDQKRILESHIHLYTHHSKTRNSTTIIKQNFIRDRKIYSSFNQYNIHPAKRCYGTPPFHSLSPHSISPSHPMPNGIIFIQRISSTKSSQWVHERQIKP